MKDAVVSNYAVKDAVTGLKATKHGAELECDQLLLLMYYENMFTLGKFLLHFIPNRCTCRLKLTF